MVVRAVVAGPLRAWTGRGKQIYDTKSGGQEAFVGAFEIAQLCIPGLMVQSGPGSARWVRTANYDQMLKNESSTPASKFFS